MKYKPIIWLFMTGRMKRGLKEIWPETNALLKKAIRNNRVSVWASSIQ